jgi:hypothetical protein
MGLKYSKQFLDISDLYLAYKKAKVEAFYERLHPSALAFSKYEENLDYNLNNLLKKINSFKYEWHKDVRFIGAYNYVPKSIDFNESNQNKSLEYFVNPIDDWKSKFKNNKTKWHAKYRLVIDATVNFHIIAALWILKVGHLFEQQLDQDVSYGNRIRRFKGKNPFNEKESGDINNDSLGLFQPYFSAYQKWRSNGLNVMKKSMENKEEIYAITMDLTSFYHNINANFILSDEFLKIMSIELSDESKVFTRELIIAIDTWYKNTPDYPDKPTGAIPVGLSASKVIANVVLHQFDIEMNSSLEPKYYGRYVDDIFLVIDKKMLNNETTNVISWIVEKVNCLDFNSEDQLILNLPYAKDSSLIFGKDKQKVFHLSSGYGIDFVNQIYSQIRYQSSEYRLLAELPDNVQKMASKALLTTPDASLEADSLRKADVISFKRLGFSLLLSDIESYAKDLTPKSWIEKRIEFYSLIDRYLLTPQGFFNYTSYFYRVFSLMITCNDIKNANSFIDKLGLVLNLLEDTTTDCTVNEIKIQSCKMYVVKTLTQSAIQASTMRTFTSWMQLGKLLRKLFLLADGYKITTTSDALKKQSNRLLISDLGRMPYKEYWYYVQNEDLGTLKEIPKKSSIKRVLHLASIRTFQNAAKLKSPYWYALVFPTRPLTIQEIIIIEPSILQNSTLLKKAIFGLRGARVHSKDLIGVTRLDTDNCIINIPSVKKSSIVVALTSIKTSNLQWENAVGGKPDRTSKRYTNLNKLVNNILKEKKDIDYIAFPECSIPRRWAFSMAHKLAQYGISLICGLEYYKDPLKMNKLKNDSLISLTTKWSGYRSNIVFLQSKLQPAHEEKKFLKKYKKTLLEPKISPVNLPIYKHGDYYFGVLICSDLTNIQNRLHFQGKVDSLFVLEWNKDVKTFSFLIESATHDIHTFVIQVNNRLYGDSRIRAPYTEEYKRDLIQVKGGTSDFYVIGKIDYNDLRKFQNQKRFSEKNPPMFKPKPIGFNLASWRKFS